MLLIGSSWTVTLLNYLLSQLVLMVCSYYIQSNLFIYFHILLLVRVVLDLIGYHSMIVLYDKMIMRFLNLFVNSQIYLYFHKY